MARNTDTEPFIRLACFFGGFFLALCPALGVIGYLLSTR